MLEIPSRWSFNQSVDYAPLPETLREDRIWVTVNGHEYKAVSAVNVDEGWVEVIACDSNGKKLITCDDEGRFNVIRVRIRGKVEQGVR